MYFKFPFIFGLRFWTGFKNVTFICFLGCANVSGTAYQQALFYKIKRMVNENLTVKYINKV